MCKVQSTIIELQFRFRDLLTQTVTEILIVRPQIHDAYNNPGIEMKCHSNVLPSALNIGYLRNEEAYYISKFQVSSVFDPTR